MPNFQLPKVRNFRLPLTSRDARPVGQTKARFAGPPEFAGRATPSPANGFSRNTRHETRITAFMLFFPRFPGISRYSSVPPSPRSRCPRAVSRSSRRPPGCFRCGERKMNHAEKGGVQQPVAKVPWEARRAPAHPRRGVRRSSDPGDLLRRTTKPTAANVRRPKGAKKKTRHSRSASKKKRGECGATFLERLGVTPSASRRITPPA